MADNFILDDGQQFILAGDLPAGQVSFGAPNLNTFIKVSIDLLNIKTGESKTIQLINREFQSQIDAFPLLMQVDGVGLKLGVVLPDSSRGAILIKNQADSFGSERRFSDLFNRYTIIERDIKVWVAQLPLGKETLEENDFELVWTAVGTDASFDSDKCRISMARADIPVRVMTYVVNLDQFPDAPSASLGKNLPIIFSPDASPIEVEAIRVTDMTLNVASTSVDYVFATTLGNRHVVDVVGNGASATTYLMMENRSREWQRVNLKSWNAFAIGYDGTLFDHDVNDYSYNGTWDPALKEIAYKFTPGQNIEAGQILIGVDWFLSSVISSNFYNFQPAKFTLKVYSSWNNYPDELIASDTIDCETDYATRLELQTDKGSASYIYKFKFELNKAVIVPEDSAIFISIERNDISDGYTQGIFGPVQTNNQDDGSALPSFEQYYLFNSNEFLRNLQEQNQLIINALTDSAEKTAAQTRLDADATLLASQVQGWKFHAITAGKDHFHTYGLAVYPTFSTPSEYQNGLGYRGFKLYMRNQESPNLESIRFIVKALGLRDGTNGAITGTPFALLENPLHQIRALMRHWNGSEWVDRQFDHTKFSDTHTEYLTGRWSIKSGGATQGRQLLRDILGAICNDTMTRLVPFVSETDYSLGLFCYGTKRDRTFILNDENAMLIGAEIKGIETVVNHVQMVYKRTIQSRSEELMAEGGFKQYNAFIDSDTDGLDVSFDGYNLSQSTWGVRPLGTISFDWLQDDDSARSVGALILARYLYPQMTFKVAVPYAECPLLEGMDVIDIKFVNLPAYYGSSQNARPLLAGTEDETVDLLNGHYWKRAQKYRCAVLGNELQLRAGEPLQHVLTLLAINPVMNL